MNRQPSKFKRNIAVCLLCSGVLMGALQCASPWVQATLTATDAPA